MLKNSSSSDSFFNDKNFNLFGKISNSYIILLALLCIENNSFYQCFNFNDGYWKLVQ